MREYPSKCSNLFFNQDQLVGRWGSRAWWTDPGAGELGKCNPGGNLIQEGVPGEGMSLISM